MDVSLDEFWLTLPDEFAELKAMAIRQLVKFGSTYVCESAFSSMNMIKDELRSRLTNDNLEIALCVANTLYEPDYYAVLSSMDRLRTSY